MNDEQRDACLTDIRLKVVRMSTDITWVKRIVAVLILALAALLGVSLPPGLIE
jgi:hypothetical protein